MLQIHTTSRWLPPIAWMALIFAVSSQPTLPRVVPQGLETLFARAAHFSEYLVLGVLLARAGGDRRRAFALACLYALTDEFHQAFVPGRNPSIEDLLADAGGSLAGVWLSRLKR